MNETFQEKTGRREPETGLVSAREPA